MTPKSNLKTDHKKEPSIYTCETVVDKSKIFSDDLQNFMGNKIHEKVAQSIDNFIDELVEGEDSSFPIQTRTSVNLILALQQEVDSHNLPQIPLIRFKIFYATALTTMKRDFGNSLFITHSRRSFVFDKLQVKANDKINLPQFHQQLKCNNS